MLDAVARVFKVMGDALAARRLPASPPRPEPSAPDSPTTGYGASAMQISQRGVDLIKEFEGLRLKAYLCPANVLTIGYGSTGRHVTEGLVITEAKAEELLRADLGRFEDAVRKAALPCTQGQFDALVSFAFNVGIGNLNSSTLLRKHKAGDKAGAAVQFGRWNKARVKGVLRVLPGLTRRRKAEAALYLS